jgi:hypothetical protein
VRSTFCTTQFITFTFIRFHIFLDLPPGLLHVCHLLNHPSLERLSTMSRRYTENMDLLYELLQTKSHSLIARHGQTDIFTVRPGHLPFPKDPVWWARQGNLFFRSHSLAPVQTTTLVCANFFIMDLRPVHSRCRSSFYTST